MQKMVLHDENKQFYAENLWLLNQVQFPLFVYR